VRAEKETTLSSAVVTAEPASSRRRLTPKTRAGPHAAPILPACSRAGIGCAGRPAVSPPGRLDHLRHRRHHQDLRTALRRRPVHRLRGPDRHRIPAAGLRPAAGAPATSAALPTPLRHPASTPGQRLDDDGRAAVLRAGIHPRRSSVRHLPRQDGRRLPERDDHPRQTRQATRPGSIRSVSTDTARCSHRGMRGCVSPTGGRNTRSTNINLDSGVRERVIDGETVQFSGPRDFGHRWPDSGGTRGHILGSLN